MIVGLVASRFAIRHGEAVSSSWPTSVIGTDDSLVALDFLRFSYLYCHLRSLTFLLLLSAEASAWGMFNLILSG